MKTLGKMALAFGLFALMSAPALAQGRGGFGGGRFGGPGALLSNKGVQEELKANDDQVKKLNALGEEYRAKAQEQRASLADVPQDQRQEKMQELQKTTNAELHKSLVGVLKPEQLKRFHQIQTQQAGVNAFATPRVQEALKLTDDQNSKIREINADLMTSTREAFQGAADDREGAMKKITDLRKAALDKVNAMLSADQKSAWKELTGEPYEVKYEPRPNNN